MACSPEFIQYITEQLKNAGRITCRKMFGEYGMFLDGKIVAIICEDQLFFEGDRSRDGNVSRIKRQSLPRRGICFLSFGRRDRRFKMAV